MLPVSQQARAAVPPPDGAVVLFAGYELDLKGWRHRDGRPASWTVEGGVMTVGKGDIVSCEEFTDAYLHVEFRVPDQPHVRRQHRGNSGIYLQGRYEIQVLDSYRVQHPGKTDCGAVYGQSAPLVNRCLPPLYWQSFDIIFRAARTDGSGRVRQAARLTVLQNGGVIHNNLTLRGPTRGAMDRDVGRPGPLLLQDHGSPVQYRNIWLVHLPAVAEDGRDVETSKDNGPGWLPLHFPWLRRRR